jgi:hypothetical protein
MEGRLLLAVCSLKTSRNYLTHYYSHYFLPILVRIVCFNPPVPTSYPLTHATTKFAHYLKAECKCAAYICCNPEIKGFGAEFDCGVGTGIVVTALHLLLCRNFSHEQQQIDVGIQATAI